MVTTKHCCYGVCVNDSRYPKHDVWFIGFGNGFPKPAKDREKCIRWVNNCGRRDFTINNVNKDTYICNHHFVGGNGPTEKNPDPIKFGITVTRPKKRKSPVDRTLSSQEKKRKSISTRSEEVRSENEKIAQILLEYLGSKSQEYKTKTASETRRTVQEDQTSTVPVEPVLVKPDRVKPVPVKPDLHVDKAVLVKPDLVKPDLDKPVLVKPDLVKPDLDKPDLDKPDLVKPDLFKPDLDKPVLVEIDLVKPDLVDRSTQTVETFLSENVSLAIKNKLLQKEIEHLKNQLHLISAKTSRVDKLVADQ